MLAFLTVATPLFGALLVWLTGMASERLMKWVATLIAIATGVLSLQLLFSLPAGSSEGYLWIPNAAVEIGFNLTGMGVWVAVVAGCVGCMAVIFSLKYMEHDEHEYAPTRYYFFTILFIGGMVGLALTNNLLMLYLFWEVIGFCSYILIAYYYHDPKAVRSGTKAFVVTRLGDVGLLWGIVVLWQATGTTNIFEILQMADMGNIPTYTLGLAGAGFILAAVAKSAQFPLHVWLPDAMEAPTTISALIHAACLVNAGVYLLALTYPMFVVLAWWAPTVLWIGCLTALFAGILALIETDIKRVLAYSTVSQLGFMVAAVGAGGLFAAQFHLVNHAIFKALLFLCAGAIVHTLGTRDLRQMGGLFKKMPITGTCCAIGVMALAGIPVLNGFWSKDLILGALQSVSNVHPAPFIILVIAALLTAAYSLRMYWMAFLGPKLYENEAHDGPALMSLPLAALAVTSCLVWLATSFYSQQLVAGVEFHEMHTLTLEKLVEHTIHSPLAMVVTGLVLAIWLIFGITWAKTGKVLQIEGPAATALSETKFGFDLFYQTGVNMMKRFCQALRQLQTGDINYNAASAALGLLILLLLLVSN